MHAQIEKGCTKDCRDEAACNDCSKGLSAVPNTMVVVIIEYVEAEKVCSNEKAACTCVGPEDSDKAAELGP
jgi:hypothetical protein